MFDFLCKPKSLIRDPEQQKLVNLKTKKLSLYHFSKCPFCLMVQSQIKKLSLNIELRDIRKEVQFYNELVKEGGKPTVPCLRIEGEGKVTWLYESSDIIAYLNTQFVADVEH